ncbi:hypothetical protein COHA_007638 [Chlorella ohadii]|uniref:MYND-type domain-containing protein n=1 Tax=Chlorella ohadii TaxID=2649997 RepID=A0AAD5H380_9CHLO|nr:hypothetical protein COHA_007638 [Chlorella ohadii]
MHFQPVSRANLLSSLTLVQMIVAALLASNAEASGVAHALSLMNGAVEELWPSATDPVIASAQQQLRQRRWLPALPDGPDRLAAALAELGMTPAARALASDLRQHCPDVTLTVVRCLALQLRVAMLDQAQQPRGQPSPANQLALQQQMLVDCQVLVQIGSGRCSLHAASVAASMLLGSEQPALQAAGTGAEALAVQGLERSIAAGRWQMAAAKARQLSSVYFGAAADPSLHLAWAAGRSRATMLDRAEQLLAQAASYLPRLRPWLPSLQMQAMDTYQRRFEESCANARQGQSVRQEQLPYYEVLAAAPKCSQCGAVAPHLRHCARCKSVKYCSRECQKKDWSAGHKRSCAALAQQRAEPPDCPPKMSATEVALGKLRQARERLAAEERSPDLDHLMSCFQLQETAWTELQAAARGPALAPGMLWDTTGASRNPQLFRGLPIAARTVHPTTGQMVLFQPPGPANFLSSVTLVQMVVAAMLASTLQANDHALLLVNGALEELWPSSSDPAVAAAKQQLRRRRWVPALPDGDSTSASAAVPLEAAPAEEPLTGAARALESDLRQHCPDVTLTALRCLALQLRVSILDQKQQPRGESPPANRLALQQRMLADCQVLMQLGGGSSVEALHAASAAASMLLTTHQPALQASGTAAEALPAEALEGAIAAKRWQMAAGHARQLSSVYFGVAAGPNLNLAWATGRPRAALLDRAEQLLQQAASYLPRLRPWLPSLQMQAMDTYQQRFEESCADARRGKLDSLH